MINIEHVELGNLTPYVNNARTHSDSQITQIAASIKEFGFNNPILLADDNTIIAGHGRFEAAKKIGLQIVPCVYLSHLSETQRKAYVLADNRIAMNAGWDEQLLAIDLKELEQAEFDLDLLGFSTEEIDELIKDNSKSYDEEKQDEIPETEQNEFGVERGQIWQLGEHRIMCGDSTSEDDVERLMAGEKADMVFTDPPYRMQVEGGSNQQVGKAARKLGEAIKHLCDFDPEEFLKRIPEVFEKSMNAYVFCNKDLVPDYLYWALEKGYNFNILVWQKPNAIPLGGSHRPDVEYLLLFRKSATWNNGLKDVSYSKVLPFGRENSTDHPTMKPVALIENEVKISSKKGTVVVDFFLGSGSTLIACEKTGRKCYGMEIDPHYCSVIIKRWQEFTGMEAKKLNA